MDDTIQYNTINGGFRVSDVEICLSQFVNESGRDRLLKTSEAQWLQQVGLLKFVGKKLLYVLLLVIKESNRRPGLRSGAVTLTRH